MIFACHFSLPAHPCLLLSTNSTFGLVNPNARNHEGCVGGEKGCAEITFQFQPQIKGQTSRLE